MDFDPHAIRRALFDRAKGFWEWSLACGVFGPMFGLLSNFLSLPPYVAPLALVALAVAAEVLQWRSDSIKDVAESLLRKLDLRDGFGWTISKREMSDVLAQHTGLDRSFAAHASGEPYFGSAESPGVKRALANLEESAWWSKHLARGMGMCCLVTVALLTSAALVALVVTVEAVRASTAAHAVETLHIVGDVVTASLTLVFSLGLTRLGVAYYVFGGKAEDIEKEVGQALSQPDTTERQAVKLWQDYHLARATAPFIPTGFWKLRRDRLNAIWDNRTARS